MPVSKSDQVVNTLGQRIVACHYKSKLPSETKLCQEFDVSRNVIREALRTLGAKNLIEIQPYKGTYVSPNSHWNFFDTDVLQWVLNDSESISLLVSLNEIRSAFEPHICRWAARSATSHDLADIENALTEMVANTNNRQVFAHADVMFHSAILRSTHNLVLQHLLQPLNLLLYTLLSKFWNPASDQINELINEHYNLLYAIRHQDEAAADKAITILIAMSNKFLQRQVTNS